jgi:hypothetical protein
MLNKGPAILAGQMLALGLVAVATTGCIVVKIAPPKKGDAFQPPPAAEVVIQKGATHKIRMNCGQTAKFGWDRNPVDNLVIDYKAVNLTPKDQLETAAMRIKWTGPGVTTDIPVHAGDSSGRATNGNLSITGPAGRHDMTFSMEGQPACGPVNLTLTFR